MRTLVIAIALTACSSNPGHPGAGTDSGTGGSGGSGSHDGSTGNGDAPVATGKDPAMPGDYTPAHNDVSIPGAGSGRTVPATVYVASGSPTPRTLVVLSPGFQMDRTQYASYAEHMASWGFAVVLTDYADKSFSADHAKLAADVPKVIDWALAQSNLAVDPNKIAVAGHSLGGDISTFAGTLDSRIKAVVGWDPVDASPSVVPEKMSMLTGALAVIGETTDSSGGFMPCAPAADNFQQFYTAAHSPAYQLTLAGADHMDWVDDPSCTFCQLCTAGTADPSLARTTTRRVDVAWLKLQLDHDTSMNAWLDAPPEPGTSVARK